MSTAPAAPDSLSAARRLSFIGVSVVAAAAYAAVVAIPTAIVANPFFHRMTPPTVWSFVFWVAPAILFGPLAASYAVPLRAAACTVENRTIGAGFLSYFAVGCPICNKLVVAVLGVSGALTYFQPVQPLLGALSVGLLGAALWIRLAPMRSRRGTG